MERARALLARTFGADEVLLLDSGRSALQLAIGLSLPDDAGGRVVALPAFQCYEVASAAVGADCRIALYDVDPHTLEPRLDSLAHAVRAGARSIVVAPLYGFPVRWEPIAELARASGCVLIEDAAQSHGAEWNGRPLGSFGALSVLSFGRGKGWTGGGGGALLLRSAELVMRARADRRARSRRSAELRAAVTSTLQMLLGRPAVYGIPAAIPGLGLGETHYHEPAAPADALPFSAALLLETREASAREVAIRRGHAARWTATLPAEILAGAPVVPAGGVAGFLRFPVCLPAEVVPAASGARARHAGVARSYPLTLGELPAVKPRLVPSSGEWPGAHLLSRRVVTLPTHSRLTRDAHAAIVAMSHEWLQNTPSQDTR